MKSLNLLAITIKCICFNDLQKCTVGVKRSLIKQYVFLTAKSIKPYVVLYGYQTDDKAEIFRTVLFSTA